MFFYARRLRTVVHPNRTLPRSSRSPTCAALESGAFSRDIEKNCVSKDFRHVRTFCLSCITLPFICLSSRMRLLLVFVALGMAFVTLPMKKHKHSRRTGRSIAWDDPLTGGSSQVRKLAQRFFFFLFSSKPYQAAYYVDLEVGTPPQKIRMDPDTGSSNFVVVSPECGCQHFGTGYDSSISSTAEPTTCGSNCANKTTPLYLEDCNQCSGDVTMMSFFCSCLQLIFGGRRVFLWHVQRSSAVWRRLRGQR